MGGALLTVRDLRKSYRHREVLHGISFEVEEGEIFGLLGPNGAGKTTTLRIIVGLLHPDGGEVLVLGKSPSDSEVRRKIGYLPEESDAYERLTGYENLYFYARLYARDRGEAEEMARYGALLSGLGGRLGDPAGTYSRGMKRRLLLARVLMTKPKLAILDEPTTGLDVYHAVKVRETIKKYVKESGAAVLLSTHNMLEASYLCSRIALLNDGVIVEEGSPRKLLEKYAAENLEEVFVKAVDTYKQAKTTSHR